MPNTIRSTAELLSLFSDNDQGLITAQSIRDFVVSEDKNLLDHTSNIANPHSVTKTQVGLSNVDNTSDVNKPVSTSQQTALDAKAAAFAVGYGLWLAGGTLRRRYAQPGAAGLAWFTYTVSSDPTTGLPTVYNSDGTAFDVSQLRPANSGQTYYVGYPGASDTNNGLTTGTSFGSLAKAVTMIDVGRIVVKAGYYLSRALVAISGGSPLRRNLIIESDTPGSVFISSAHETTLSIAGNWTATAGQANVWQSTPTSGVRTGIASVWDTKTLDAEGDYIRLTLQTSVANVTANAGSYYVDATNIYVHTADNRQPDTFLRVFQNQYNIFLASDGYTLYLQDIYFEGGITGIQFLDTGGGNRPTLIAKNCTFKYASSATAGNGVTAQGCVTWMQSCTATQNALDGFNYHSHSSLLCRSVEISCVGRNNGWNGAGVDSQNGSTTHDGNSIVRVNGRYYGNFGPNIADVTAGTTSWNVGCGIWKSTATTTATQNANVQSQCSGTGGVWLDSCWGFTDPAVAAAYQFVVLSGAALYFRSFSGGLNFYQISGATFQSY